jgi:hypothetical protein
MALKPWYKVVTPREDLREGRPMDASEFAVHLDQIRDGRAPDDYQRPRRFFERTYLTKGLEDLSAEVVRRLSGIKTETSAVFNLSTQFGGGKTHALALLYHLAKGGPEATSWLGVTNILGKAGVTNVPQAAIAVFVGTEFDSIAGRGGENGEPLRKTPWGEIAWQLGGVESFKIVAEQDKQLIAPGNDVIRKILPKDRPCLILMDELMNYISRYRKMGMVTQFYNFLQNLSEEARGQNNVVLVVSIPASELEMTAEDHSDHERFKKLLDRLGKAVMMSAEGETSEIIRRRLFEWTGVPEEAKKTINEYADWIVEHRNQVGDFPVDSAKEAFLASYPFHPTVLSVFERKWQGLPRFQRTRGILRLLALWVSRAYQDGFKGAHKDPLITLGTAPMDDPIFRSPLLEQLGEPRLEPVITTDIAGKPDAHSIILDKEAVDAIKKARLHRKVATAIFFESNGGQSRTDATIPEIRLAVAEPGLDLGNIETVLETLGESCYYLRVERNHYRFGLTVTLNKILADRRATISEKKIDERARAEIQKVFATVSGIEKVFFPDKSGQIPDRAALTLIILPPEQAISEGKKINDMIDTFTRENGTSSRTFKSALIWIVPDSSSGLYEDARKLLAWEDISDEAEELHLDDIQKRHLDENIRKSQRDLKESVWRTYNNIILLGKDNKMRHTPLGLVHSSAADSLVGLIINRLRQDGDIEEAISPNFLIRNWPPAFKEWSTKSVRDAFFSSPQFPRLINAEAIRDTIARGVSGSNIGYVGKTGDGDYSPFIYGNSLAASDVEITDNIFIIKKEIAEDYKSAKVTGSETKKPEGYQYPTIKTPINTTQEPGKGEEQPTPSETNITPAVVSSKLTWNGNVPPQKWMNFYTKVLSKFAGGKGLKLTLSVEVAEEGGISTQKIEETKAALRELGLDDTVSNES